MQHTLGSTAWELQSEIVLHKYRFYIKRKSKRTQFNLTQQQYNEQMADYDKATGDLR